jgi:hypothetical protein
VKFPNPHVTTRGPLIFLKFKTETCRYIAILVEIRRKWRAFYIQTYIHVSAQRNSLNIYGSEKCFEPTENEKDSLSSIYIFASVTALEITKQKRMKVQELLRYTYISDSEYSTIRKPDEYLQKLPKYLIANND